MKPGSSTLRPRMIVLHGAAVAANGGAWLFLAPPETGKSTICRRLSPYAQLVADDRIVIIPKENEWLVTTADGHNFIAPLPETFLKGGVPLRTVFRLCRAPRPRIEALSPLQTCRYMVDSFFHFYWQKGYSIEQKKSAFAEIAAVARATPGYCLYFNRSSKTVELICRMIDSFAQIG